MSVLRYGFPQSDRLRCDHPTCEEPATALLACQANIAGGVDQEVFACDNHAQQLQIGRRVNKEERLRIPGERNPKAPDIKR